MENVQKSISQNNHTLLIDMCNYIYVTYLTNITNYHENGQEIYKDSRLVLGTGRGKSEMLNAEVHRLHRHLRSKLNLLDIPSRSM